MGCVYEFEGRCLNGRMKLACDGCDGKLLLEDKEFLAKWKDPIVMIDRRRNPATDVLRDMLAGGTAFLVCGGPSADEFKMEALSRRGCWSLAVNNKAGHTKWRPSAFVCSDPPTKFTHSVWFDPGVMKFVPTAKLCGSRANLRVKKNGVFVSEKRRTYDCPNVWSYQRWSWMKPDDAFFLSDGCCWGNHESGSKRTGEMKTVCTMLIGLRLLRFLGARKVFLVGVDFRMRPDYGYSFSQDRTPGASVSNNAQFTIVNDWLCRLVAGGCFERFGMEVYNTFETSGLRAFEYWPFDKAVEEACEGIEAVPDLSAWYEK
jgi:hypothetical protein